MNSLKIYNNISTGDDWSIAEGAPPERPTAGSTGSSEYSESSVYSHLSFNPVIKNNIAQKRISVMF